MNKIILGDCLKELQKLEQNSVDIQICSPPYNLDIKYNTYQDNLPLDDYINFIQEVCNELFRVMKDGGRVCFNVPPDIGTLKNNSKVSLDTLIYNCLDKAGFKYRTKIVWNKNQITSRTAWGSFKSPSNPNILPPFEYILVFYKNNPKKDGTAENIDITKEEFINWTNGLWTIVPESKNKIKHPCPYPLELCNRLIKMFSFKNDVVLDCFAGSGSTLVSAKKLNRRYIGIEKDPQYYDICLERLK